VGLHKKQNCGILILWKVEFIFSVFHHNFTEADIRWALDNHLADGVVEEGDETTSVFRRVKR
jgi:hypothetical protein